MTTRRRQPLVVIIAGPNGAGKTTFARQYLPKIYDIVNFVNADSIAAGLSPLKPELAAISAARLVLKEIDRLVAVREDFAFESTLSGLTYVRRLQAWRKSGYRVEIAFLRLGSVRVAMQRVKMRVRQGGHDVPPADLERRFARGWKNFNDVYKTLADEWAVYDNSGTTPQLTESK